MQDSLPSPREKLLHLPWIIQSPRWREKTSWNGSNSVFYTFAPVGIYNALPTVVINIWSSSPTLKYTPLNSKVRFVPVFSCVSLSRTLDFEFDFGIYTVVRFNSRWSYSLLLYRQWHILSSVLCHTVLNELYARPRESAEAASKSDYRSQELHRQPTILNCVSMKLLPNQCFPKGLIRTGNS